MRSTSRLLMLIFSIYMSGCAITAATDCDWARPISWSSRDTEETQREIFAHNLKFEEFCGE